MINSFPLMSLTNEEPVIVVWQQARGRGPITWTQFAHDEIEQKLGELRENGAVILNTHATAEEAIEACRKSLLSGDLLFGTPCALGDYPNEVFPNRREIK